MLHCSVHLFPRTRVVLVVAKLNIFSENLSNKIYNKQLATWQMIVFQNENITACFNTLTLQISIKHKL